MRRLLSLLMLVPAAVPATAQNRGIRLRNTVPAQIDVAYHRTLVPRTGVTVEAWVTYDETTLGQGWRWPTVVRQNPAPGRESIMLRVEAGQTRNRVVKWFVRGTRGGATATWAFAPGALRTWTHLAGTYDGSRARLYVNGKLVATGTGGGGPIVDAGNVLRIGNGDTVAPIETWNGEIDEVRLWPFARTAAEITSTMRLEIQRVPGEVSTWNLNGDAKDSSGRNHGRASAKVVYAANTLKLTKLPFLGALAFGRGTPGCGPTPVATVSGWPKVGNTGFAILGLHGTASGSGVVLVSGARRTTPIKVLTVEIWVDLAAAAAPVPAHPLRLGRLPLPIPTNPWLAGKSIYAQMFFLERGCKNPLFSTDGIGVTFFP